MEVWILVLAIIWLIIWGIASAGFRDIAREKGYDEGKYFWWTFLLGLVGMLMVIALPDRGAPVMRNNSKDHSYSSNDLPDL